MALSCAPLFVKPDYADNNFYYGINFEFSWNSKWWETQVNTREIRPIIGFRFGNDNRFSLSPLIPSWTIIQGRRRRARIQSGNTARLQD